MQQQPPLGRQKCRELRLWHQQGSLCASSNINNSTCKGWSRLQWVVGVDSILFSRLGRPTTTP